MIPAARDSPSARLRYTAWLLVAAALLLSLREMLVRPGWADIDEVWQLRYLQHWREGGPLPFELFQGVLHRLMLAATTWLSGADPGAWRINHWMLLLGESLLLYAVGSRLLGRRAALFAVIVNVGAAFFFLRARSLLCFGIFPWLWLLFAAVRLLNTKPWQAFAWATAVGLLCLDYEAWLLGALTLLLLPLPKNRRFGASVAGGLSLAFGLLLWISFDSLQTWLQIRANQTLPSTTQGLAATLWSNTLAFLFGGQGFAYLNVPNHSFLPWWIYPGLVIAAWVPQLRRRWLWLSFGLGLFPLALSAVAFEMNRLVAAWIPACLLAGSGFAWLSRRSSGREWAVLALALIGFLYQWKAFDDVMSREYPRIYSRSVNLLRVQDWVRSKPVVSLDPKVTLEHFYVVAGLDGENGAEARFLLDPPSTQADDRSLPLALVPWTHVRKPLPPWGHWVWFEGSSGQGPTLVLVGKAFEPEQTLLRNFWQEFNTKPGTAIFEEAGRRMEMPQVRSNPWLLNAFVELRVRYGLLTGRLRVDELRSLLELKLPSETSRINLALHLAKIDPKEALEQFRLAAKRDPRRRLAFRMQLQLMEQLGMTEARRALMEQLPYLAADKSYEPAWYWQ